MEARHAEYYAAYGTMVEALEAWLASGDTSLRTAVPMATRSAVTDTAKADVCAMFRYTRGVHVEGRFASTRVPYFRGYVFTWRPPSRGAPPAPYVSPLAPTGRVNE